MNLVIYTSHLLFFTKKNQKDYRLGTYLGVNKKIILKFFYGKTSWEEVTLEITELLTG
jgi:hypothetical protein